jgi:hypothetical protein
MMRVATMSAAMQNAHTLNIEPVSKGKHSERSRPLEGRVKAEGEGLRVKSARTGRGADSREQKKIIPYGSIASRGAVSKKSSR